jgi:hypothetical protein
VTRPALTVSGASSVARGQSATIAWSYSGGASAPVSISLVQGTRVVAVKSGAVTGGRRVRVVRVEGPDDAGPGQLHAADPADAAGVDRRDRGDPAFTVS